MLRLPPSGGQQTNPRSVVGYFERCLSAFRVTWKRRTPGWRSRCKPLMSKTASHKDDYVALMCSFRVPGAAADRDRKARRRGVTYERESENEDEGAVTAANVAIFGGRGGRTAGGTSSCASEATFSPLPASPLRPRHARRRGRLRQTPSDAGKYANHIPLPTQARTRGMKRVLLCANLRLTEIRLRRIASRWTHSWWNRRRHGTSCDLLI